MCLLRAAQMEGVGGSSGEMLCPARFHYHHDGTLGKKVMAVKCVRCGLTVDEGFFP